MNGRLVIAVVAVILLAGLIGAGVTALSGGVAGGLIAGALAGGIIAVLARRNDGKHTSSRA